MAAYREIDNLLLLANKGLFSAGSARDGNGPPVPVPGDSVLVSFSESGLSEILVHLMENSICRGETRTGVFDKQGRRILAPAEKVLFSYNRIAGIHR